MLALLIEDVTSVKREITVAVGFRADSSGNTLVTGMPNGAVPVRRGGEQEQNGRLRLVERDSLPQIQMLLEFPLRLRPRYFAVH